MQIGLMVPCISGVNRCRPPVKMYALQLLRIRSVHLRKIFAAHSNQSLVRSTVRKKIISICCCHMHQRLQAINHRVQPHSLQVDLLDFLAAWITMRNCARSNQYDCRHFELQRTRRSNYCWRCATSKGRKMTFSSAHIRCTGGWH